MVAKHTLVVTNDFPPREGGIQTFIFELVSRFEPSTVTVLASHFEGDVAFDATLPFSVIRSSYSVLLPTPATSKLARRIITDKKVTRVVFGAAAPLGLLAPTFRSHGVKALVGITHGHEAGWAITPVTRQLLRRIGKSLDAMTYLGDYTHKKIGNVLDEKSRNALVQLAPAVDPQVFTPENREAGHQLRKDNGLDHKQVIVCVSRLMERKGQDALIEAMPKVLSQVPNAHLVIVGGGSYEPTLRKLIDKLNLENYVTMTGKVAFDQLAKWYAVGDVFAMPCRTRNGGWDVEGLGIVFLEASATGLPVIAGNSGGAPDAVIDGVTGYVVDGRDQSDIVNRLVQVLSNEALASSLGAAGREWVLKAWTWDNAVTSLQALLEKYDPSS